MPTPSANPSAPESLPDIFQAAQRWEHSDSSPLTSQSSHQRSSSPHAYHSTPWDGLHESSAQTTFVVYEGAAALMPLRGRDREALQELFVRADMTQVLQDLETTLEQFQEPQDWEDVSQW